MIRFISGEVDSPMAKRGCALRSSKMTDLPVRRAIIASSEPENPEPIMARSKSIFIRKITGRKIKDRKIGMPPGGFYFPVCHFPVAHAYNPKQSGHATDSEIRCVRFIQASRTTPDAEQSQS